MKITYDGEASASYIYFTSIRPGGVAETVACERLDVDLDEEDQIIALRFFEFQDSTFPRCLKYALQHSNVTYDESARSVRISFTNDATVNRSISWDVNIDLDDEGQLLGLEILFTDADYYPDGTQKALYAGNKLKFVSQYVVPFDPLLE
jgi:uncharacterized protein YuzE